MPCVHTVELLLDGKLEDAVRRLWGELHEAGQPSLATHRHPTNRPHVTLAVAETLDGRVAADPALLRLQEQVWERLDGVPRNPLHHPERWVPHVSLALKAGPDALAHLVGLPAPRGLFVTARTYDMETRTVNALSPAADGSRA